MKAMMFSGQGAQKTGMGKEFYENFDICRKTFDQASEALGLDMARLCFEDGEGLLNQTQYAQPALLTVGVSAFRLLEARVPDPGLLMGLSLGEYTALTAAGVFAFADALRLVHRRGQIMTELGKPGSMIACMGLDRPAVQEICAQAGDEGTGFAAPANYNTPDQIVLAGEQTALDFCAAKIKARGGKSIPLKVAGPFHTALLAQAATQFKEEFASLVPTTGKAKYPVLSNLTGQEHNYEHLKDNLARHMVSPVLWVNCVEKAMDLGTTSFIELGCGKTLVNFVKKIAGSGADSFAIAIETLKDLEGFCERA